MAWPDTDLTELLGTRYPLVQAPMATVTTPELVAAVTGTGGLGSLGGAMLAPDQLRTDIAAIRTLTDAPFAVNLFAPIDTPPAPAQTAAMAEALAPWRERFGLGPSVEPPQPPPSLVDDQLAVVIETRPAVFSFTFGIPPADALDAMRDVGITLIGTATAPGEAVMLEEAGCDAVVAQGSEAGGHRGTFALPFERALIGTIALVPQVVDAVEIPVIAAGGIMDGRGIAAALALGAAGAQLGTAFIACPESAAPRAHKRSLAESDASATTVTDAFTGRPARGLRTLFFEELERSGPEIPPYPLQAMLVAELRQTGLERGELDTVSRLAGQGAPMARELPAAELLERLVAEAEAALDIASPPPSGH
jgi:nitronate monooxygenase